MVLAFLRSDLGLSLGQDALGRLQIECANHDTEVFLTIKAGLWLPHFRGRFAGFWINPYSGCINREQNAQVKDLPHLSHQPWAQRKAPTVAWVEACQVFPSEGSGSRG
jgi:hypothetical protein